MRAALVISSFSDFLLCLGRRGRSHRHLLRLDRRIEAAFHEHEIGDLLTNLDQLPQTLVALLFDGGLQALAQDGR